MREIQQTLGIGGDVTADEVGAAKKLQLQSVRAVLHVNHPGQLVERHSARKYRGAGKLADPARFTDRA